jgi:ATP synthase F1 delta subunit
MKECCQSAVARKYATAYMHVFLDALSMETITHMSALTEFLSRNRRISFFFTLAALDVETKKSGITFLCTRFKMPPSMKKLMLLMLEHKRLFLLEKVLCCIQALYKKEKKIESFTITSSHALSQSALDVLQGFLAQRTGNDIIYTYAVDEKLIAGIRMQGDFHIWEYSIAQQLRLIQVPLARKGNYGR